MTDLKTLKNQILDDLIALTDEGLEPEEQFQVILSRYVSTGETDLLEKAYAAAKNIKNVSDKGNALMQLADELDIAQANQTNEQTDEASDQANDNKEADQATQTTETSGNQNQDNQTDEAANDPANNKAEVNS